MSPGVLNELSYRQMYTTAEQTGKALRTEAVCSNCKRVKLKGCNFYSLSVERCKEQTEKHVFNSVVSH